MTTAAGTIRKKDVKVYILDLRGSDAWNWEWALAKCSDFDGLVPTQEMLYTDCYDDFILYDGDEDAAVRFFTNYCRKHDLELVATNLT